jgi:cob(I)alamin adenosyltransferase
MLIDRRNSTDMSISTRKGDTGQTDLLFGQRVAKNHPRVRALGSVDELNAALGLLRIYAKRGETIEVATRAQELLIPLMGELATPVGREERYKETHQRKGIIEEHVALADGWVATLEREGAFKFTGWVLPGAAGSAGGAHADHARAVCRRAECEIIDLEATGDALPNAEVVKFLNRLSDVLWLLARWEEKGR